jgi:hypothetical protein
MSEQTEAEKPFFAGAVAKINLKSETHNLSRAKPLTATIESSATLKAIPIALLELRCMSSNLSAQHCPFAAALKSVKFVYIFLVGLLKVRT